MSLAFFILRGGNFFLKRKGHFSLVFCPPSIRAGGGTNADSVLPKHFFWGKGFGKTSADFGFRKRRRRGLGRNPPLSPSVFSFGEIRALRKEWKVDIIDLQVIKVLYHFPYIIIYYVYNRQEHKKISARQR